MRYPVLTRHLSFISAGALLLLCMAGMAAADDAGDAAPNDQPQTISLNLPENVPLKVLIDLVSRTNDLNFLYDAQVSRKQVSIKATRDIREDQLLPLFETILRMNDLALEDTDQPGWKRIVPVQNLSDTALPRGMAPKKTTPTLVVIESFTVEHVDVARVGQVIQPFLSGRGSSTIQLREQGILMVVDYDTNMRRLREIIRLIDVPQAPRLIHLYAVEHLTPASLADQARQLLQARQRGTAPGGGDPLDFRPIERTSQLAVIGTQAQIDEALPLLEQLDVSLGLVVETYQFEYASPERVDRLVKDLIGELDARRLYQSSIDRDARLLVVHTTPQIHERLAKLQSDLDTRSGATEVPVVEFYKLLNTTATDVLATIQLIEGGQSLEDLNLGRTIEKGDSASTQPGASEDVTPATATPVGEDLRAAGDVRDSATPRLRPVHTIQSAIQTKQGKLAADVNTNSIIVIAPRNVQKIYRQLIEKLDRRRPQVMIEAVLVTMDTSNGYSFGVEIVGQGDIGNNRVLGFSSLGLSEIDADTGQVSLQPSLGFNGIVLNPDSFAVVVKALSSNGRTNVISAPKILVNDNTSGTIQSVNEAPTTSVNASNTVSTTTFAGFASAGTTITVTPHISEGAHLQVEYSVELSTFSGEGSEGVPPPRQRNSVNSSVTIPDGHTIIIGGINRQDYSKTITTVPILEHIPLIKEIVKSESVNNSNTTLFVFIRPRILRDNEFEDLKYLSHQDREEAGVPGQRLPASRPLLID